jgi:YggT family protein
MTGTLSGEIVLTIAEVLNFILEAYMWIIIVASLISWVSPDPYNPIVRFLYRVTEPVLRPIRRLIGGTLGPIDISPIVVIFVIFLIRKFVMVSLIDIAYTIQ